MITRLLPELGRFPTRATRRRAFAIAVGAAAFQWRYWLLIAAIVVGSVWLQFALRRFGIPPFWRDVLGWTLVPATVFVCFALPLSFRKTMRRALWRTLVDSGIPCCTSCGYDLRGNESGVCPECGAAGPPAKP